LTADDYKAVPKFVKKKLEIQEGYGFGCDIEHFDPARFSETDKGKLRSELGIPGEDLVVVFVGRLTAFKGFLLALEAFRQLRQERNDVHLLIVGEVDSQHPIDLPDLNQVGGVHYLGWQEDPAPHLAISNVMVFPSEREGMPVCMMEALAMGRAVVTTDSRGCRQLAELSAATVADRRVNSIAAALRTASRLSKAHLDSTEVRQQIDRTRFYTLLLESYL
jgi:glycosyltransferase involved in cell wall biosynthesis